MTSKTEGATPQEISGVFRGSADGETSLKEKAKKTEQGISARSIPTFVAGEELADLADTDSRVVVLTADLASAGRTIDFANRHPDRFFNIGVAEQNMVSVAAGMASTGLRPFVSTFAAYLALLCCEQVRTDLAYTEMPVVMLAHHSGMTLGYYGTSHHALEDLCAMRGIAGLTVVCASDANELRAILRASLDHDGPVYVRMGRGRDPEVYAEVPENFAFGKAIRLTEGSDIALITTGSQVRPCLDAAEHLAKDGIGARVVDMHTISPADAAEIRAAVDDIGTILTVEEHNVTGGLGAAVAEVIAEYGKAVSFRRHGVPDVHVTLGPPAALYAHYELDAAGVANRAKTLLQHTRGNSS
ncbi:MAG TPA: transketolase C-terminal domain-containing protein [Streptosporangiaceae bacterium]